MLEQLLGIYVLHSVSRTKAKRNKEEEKQEEDKDDV